MICIFIFAGWSGSHVEAKKSIQSKLVADSFYTGAMATPDLQDMGYHSRAVSYTHLDVYKRQVPVEALRFDGE